MRGIAGLFGSMVVVGFIFVMMNFLLKYLNKKVISKLSSDYKDFVSIYRRVMRIFIKYHKPAGIITSMLVLVHFILMSVFFRVSVTGIIAMILMLIIFLLGLYGAYINKNFKGKWLKIHRVLAFLLCLAILIHVM